MNNDGNNTECGCALNLKFDLVHWLRTTYLLFKNPYTKYMARLYDMHRPYVKKSSNFYLLFFHIVSLCNLGALVNTKCIAPLDWTQGIVYILSTSYFNAL